MTVMTTPTASTAPRRPALDRATVKQLMATEYQRVVEQLQSLSADEWQADTCNTGWDVRALAAHMLGMVAMAASVPEQLRQMRAAKKRGGEFIDALTALQVEKYDGWAPEQIVAEYARLAPKAVKGRSRMPGLLRGRAMPDPQPINPPQWEPGQRRPDDRYFANEVEPAPEPEPPPAPRSFSPVADPGETLRWPRRTGDST